MPAKSIVPHIKTLLMSGVVCVRKEGMGAKAPTLAHQTPVIMASNPHTRPGKPGWKPHLAHSPPYQEPEQAPSHLGTQLISGLDLPHQPGLAAGLTTEHSGPWLSLASPQQTHPITNTFIPDSPGSPYPLAPDATFTREQLLNIRESSVGSFSPVFIEPESFSEILVGSTAAPSEIFQRRRRGIYARILFVDFSSAFNTINSDTPHQ
ncbi:hypothetical protein CRENBAI_012920 [Crenichthys baileyi]|uniref:Uncharacterized protein n=1 Tax=Crenichthys baileyi TaxID=28760 RepID=A0AAV9RLZ0_9TELE